MDKLQNVLENPILRVTNSQKRTIIKNKFPPLNQSPNKHFLSLYKFLNSSPEKYYSEKIYQTLFDWLEQQDKTNQLKLQRYFVDYTIRLNLAFLNLHEINNFQCHEEFKKTNNYEHIRFIDQIIHPLYLRLVEAVFFPFIHLPAYFARLNRNKKTEGMDLYPSVEEIRNSNFDELIGSYKHIVRNAIAHGGITYLQNEIIYEDKKGNQVRLSDREMVQLFDDMLDICNAMSLAISIFFIQKQLNNYQLPQQLLIDELKAETNSPWWKIEGCTPSKYEELNQLIIYASPTTFDFSKVQFSAFQTGVLAEQFSPGYSRYFVALSSPMSWPGWAAFDGIKLNELRVKNVRELKDYASTIENGVFFVPKFKPPKFFSKLETLYYSFKINFISNLKNLRHELNRPEINVRDSSVHRNAWGAVLNASVMIESNTGDITKGEIVKFRKKVVKKAMRNARINSSLYEISRYLPLGFALIRVFRKDYRLRRLSNFGLKEDLICTIQVKRISRIRNPDILGATIENHGNYRIAWNKAWLEC